MMYQKLIGNSISIIQIIHIVNTILMIQIVLTAIFLDYRLMSFLIIDI